MSETTEETPPEETPPEETEPEIPLEDLEPAPVNLSPVDLGSAIGPIESTLLYNDANVFYSSFTTASFTSAGMLYATSADVGQNSNGSVDPNPKFLNRDVFVYAGDTHASTDGSDMAGILEMNKVEDVETVNAEHHLTAFDRNFIRENENTSLYTWSE